MEKVEKILKNGQDEGLLHEEVPPEGEQDKEKENFEEKYVDPKKDIEVEQEEDKGAA